jgi:predicted component of type VI protein secretion system
MQNVSIHKASHLPEAVKSAVEQLLGRSIAADEEISVVAVPPQHVPPPEDRDAVARNLEALLNRRAAKVKDVPEEEIDAVVDEAVDHVRHSRT